MKAVPLLMVGGLEKRDPAVNCGVLVDFHALFSIKYQLSKAMGLGMERILSYGAKPTGHTKSCVRDHGSIFSTSAWKFLEIA